MQAAAEIAAFLVAHLELLDSDETEMMDLDTLEDDLEAVGCGPTCSMLCCIQNRTNHQIPRGLQELYETQHTRAHTNSLSFSWTH